MKIETFTEAGPQNNFWIMVRYPGDVTNISQYKPGTFLYMKFYEKRMQYEVSVGLTNLGPILKMYF